MNLSVHIKSFFYKKGLPIDESVHGGGFVFDCRWIANLDNLEKYKNLIGKDEEVVLFLRQKTEMPLFLVQIESIIDGVIEKYLADKFVYLSIYFCCTGGQHRSVYATEYFNAYIEDKFPDIVITSLQHRDIPKLTK